MADKTCFDYSVQVIALLTGGYTLYKNFIERSQVAILSGDRIAIVSGPGGARRIHVRCILVNGAAKIGSLQRLEAQITGPDGTVQRFLWNEIFEFIAGTNSVQSAGPPMPVSVANKNSQGLLVQLEFTEPGMPAKWTTGQHRVELQGWVNRQSRLKNANARCVFHVKITAEMAARLPVNQADFRFEDVPIEEWNA